MDYNKMKENQKRLFTKEDGFSGKIIECGLAFDSESGAAIEVSDAGCFRANTALYKTEKEMLYFFDHHRKVHFPQVLQVVYSLKEQIPQM